ncbi:hypothetical protein NXF25_019131 [Crotalus adamanteus]|uniref:Uncharacterized protein n=1 Tax=Crotalus adamanteus TaxID=8729 RepID=A0AAW1B1S6_CROAD
MTEPYKTHTLSAHLYSSFASTFTLHKEFTTALT